MGYKLTGIYVGATLVRPKRREPGANTVAYYPLNSTDTLSDKSGNSYDLTNSGSVAFGTQQGVDCAWFTSGGNSSGSRGLYRTTDSIIDLQNYDYTFLVWLYKGSETMYYNPRIIGRYGGGGAIFTYASLTKISASDSITYGIEPNSGSRFLFTCVYDHSNTTWEYYKNGTYENTQTFSNSNSNSGIVLGTRDNLGTSYGDKWSGGMSEIIIENKARTNTEINNYYNQTKSNYGL